MKLDQVLKFIYGACITVILFSCESHEEISDDAFERVKVETMIEKDSGNKMERSAVEPGVALIPKKNDKPDEWAKFKSDIEKKIHSNEAMAKEIKNLPNVGINLVKKVMRLDEQNIELRKYISEFQEEEKVRREKFRSKINKDVQDIESELKSIKIEEKK